MGWTAAAEAAKAAEVVGANPTWTIDGCNCKLRTLLDGGGWIDELFKSGHAPACTAAIEMVTESDKNRGQLWLHVAKSAMETYWPLDVAETYPCDVLHRDIFDGPTKRKPMQCMHAVATTSVRFTPHATEPSAAAGAAAARCLAPDVIDLRNIAQRWLHTKGVVLIAKSTDPRGRINLSTTKGKVALADHRRPHISRDHPPTR